MLFRHPKESLLGLLVLAVCLTNPASAWSQPASTSPAAAVVDPYQAALDILKDENPMNRRRGAEQLGQLRRKEAIPVLEKLLADPHVFVRSAAVDSLGILRAPAGPIAQLLDPAKEKEASVRQSAATSLAYLGDVSAADALVRALKDPAPAVRYAAVRTLGVLRATKAVPALAKALQDPDGGMRRTVVSALGQMQAKESIGALQALLKDPDFNLRLEVVRALGSIGDLSALEGLKGALNDEQVMVRLQAAGALARLGDSSGIPVAIAGLKDADSKLRQQAAKMLGLIGDGKQGLSALNGAFAVEKDVNVKAAIESAQGQLRARLGIPDEPELPKAAPAAPEKPLKNGKPTGKNK